MTQYPAARMMVGTLQWFAAVGFVIGLFLFVVTLSHPGGGIAPSLGLVISVVCAIKFLLATAALALFDISDQLRPRKKRKLEPQPVNSDSINDSQTIIMSTSSATPEDPIETEPITPDPPPEPAKRKPANIPDMDPSLAQQIADDEMQRFKSKQK